MQERLQFEEKNMEFLICAKIDLRKKLREIENYHPTTIKGLGQIKYTNILEEAKLMLALALSVEPTFEDINSLESEVSKGTELEVILMELKDITIRYLTAQKKASDFRLKKATDELNLAEHQGNFEKSQELQVVVGKLEEEDLQKECERLRTFALLEDERPSKTFLNINSKKKDTMKPASY